LQTGAGSDPADTSFWGIPLTCYLFSLFSS
jgi:hypothetical protein